ncbi:MAG: protease complex subunit PrcB family protein [Flavobacterium sp.]|nr:protease complex subunit PrcB family protein [Flavobacterium sp.]
MKSVLFCVIAILLFGCSNDNETETPFTPVNITPIQISKGYISIDATVGPQNTVISNQSTWNQFMSDLSDSGMYAQTSPAFLETTVNFTDYRLLVVIDAMRPDTGYSINITNVIENENTINVTKQSTTIGAGYDIVIHPFHIVKIPNSDKPVVFE